jgi:hypothetical protein
VFRRIGERMTDRELQDMVMEVRNQDKENIEKIENGPA